MLKRPFTSLSALVVSLSLITPSFVLVPAVHAATDSSDMSDMVAQCEQASLPDYQSSLSNAFTTYQNSLSKAWQTQVGFRVQAGKTNGSRKTRQTLFNKSTTNLQRSLQQANNQLVKQNMSVDLQTLTDLFTQNATLDDASIQAWINQPSSFQGVNQELNTLQKQLATYSSTHDKPIVTRVWTSQRSSLLNTFLQARTDAREQLASSINDCLQGNTDTQSNDTMNDDGSDNASSTPNDQANSQDQTVVPNTGLAVVSAATAVVDPSYVSSCSQTFTFNGEISLEGPGTVQYYWTRSDDATYAGPTQTLNFNEAGTLAVQPDTWTITSSYSGWEKLVIVSPSVNTSYMSNPAYFKMDCNQSSATPVQSAPTQNSATSNPNAQVLLTLTPTHPNIGDTVTITAVLSMGGSETGTFSFLKNGQVFKTCPSDLQNCQIFLTMDADTAMNINNDPTMKGIEDIQAELTLPSGNSILSQDAFLYAPSATANPQTSNTILNQKPIASDQNPTPTNQQTQTLQTPSIVSPTNGQAFTNYPRTVTVSWKDDGILQHLISVTCVDGTANCDPIQGFDEANGVFPQTFKGETSINLLMTGDGNFGVRVQPIGTDGTQGPWATQINFSFNTTQVAQTQNSNPQTQKTLGPNVTSVTVSPDTGVITQTCGYQTFNFTGQITVDGPGTISYSWQRSDGVITSPQTLTFKAAGTQTVTYTWMLGNPGSYSVNLVVPTPNSSITTSIAGISDFGLQESCPATKQ